MIKKKSRNFLLLEIYILFPNCKMKRHRQMIPEVIHIKLKEVKHRGGIRLMFSLTSTGSNITESTDNHLLIHTKKNWVNTKKAHKILLYLLSLCARTIKYTRNVCSKENHDKWVCRKYYSFFFQQRKKRSGRCRQQSAMYFQQYSLL